MFCEFIMVRISSNWNSAKSNFYPNESNNYFLNEVYVASSLFGIIRSLIIAESRKITYLKGGQIKLCL
uniref:Uncharacterized protein n=1 Tax=Bacillus cereus TaxID=1396 RepID=A0A5B9HRA5_BACCE|nr:hypothetical protein FRY47_17225 [Bacillus cereus]